MTKAGNTDQPGGPQFEQAVRDGLARVSSSPQLSNSDRLKSFLDYVVEESLQGRSDEIIGKIIAHRIYGRDGVDGGDSIVRVDARRLRRALAEYYYSDGKHDPVRIHIDKGSYAPRFELLDDVNTGPVASNEPRPRFAANIRPAVLAAIGGATLAVLAGLLLLPLSGQFAPATREGPDDTDALTQERMALADKSMATLQAYNMSVRASELLFPLADVEFQKSASKMFREAIRLDPDFSGGYAGVAHSLATLAILAPDPDTRAQLLKDAGDMANRAVDLDPTSGWSVSSKAWLAFARGDIDSARTLANRSFLLNREDGRVRDYYALILLLTGNFAEAQKVSDPQTPRKFAGRHQAHRNIFGVASFHLEEYAKALASFESAIALGGPVSELTLVFKAASYQATGETALARQQLTELSQTWPKFRPEAIRRFYALREHADFVLAKLQAAGWRFNPGPDGQ